MVRVMNSYAQARRLAELVAEMWRQKGSLRQDEPFVAYVNETLAHAYKGVALHFYEVLQEQCPEALRLF